jgi:hypothetical protein
MGDNPPEDLERLAAALDAAWDAGELTPVAIETSIGEYRARHPYRPQPHQIEPKGGDETPHRRREAP